MSARTIVVAGAGIGGLTTALALADKGWRKALAEDPHLRAGLNVCAGLITCEPVATAHGLPYRSAESLLSEAG